jgi:pyridoxamine 5'-phosphate oxidase family protein
MSTFSQEEVQYLAEQRLGRLATVNAAGQPHVVPVSFSFEAETETIALGGVNVAGTKKVRDLLTNAKAALVVDDIASFNPWRVRGIEIRGTAELVEAGGERLGPGFGAS